MERESKKKNIRQVIETEILDVETGEITTSKKTHISSVTIEENYVKLFCNCLSKIVGLTQAEADVFHSIITTMGYNNMVCFSGPARELISQSLGISQKTLEKAVKELKDREIIIPIKMNGKTRRGWYVVNPNYVAKGGLKQIEALKMMITIEADGRAFLSLGARYEGETLMSKEFPIELPKDLKL